MLDVVVGRCELLRNQAETTRVSAKFDCCFFVVTCVVGDCRRKRNETSRDRQVLGNGSDIGKVMWLLLRLVVYGD